MIRSGDDVLVIDRCVRRRHSMPPPLSGFSDDYAPVMSVVLYLNGKLTRGTRIHQLANGHKYIVSPCLHSRTVVILGFYRPNWDKNAVSPKFQVLSTEVAIKVTDEVGEDHGLLTQSIVKFLYFRNFGRTPFF